MMPTELYRHNDPNLFGDNPTGTGTNGPEMTERIQFPSSATSATGDRGSPYDYMGDQSLFQCSGDSLFGSLASLRQYPVMDSNRLPATTHAGNPASGDDFFGSLDLLRQYPAMGSMGSNLLPHSDATTHAGMPTHHHRPPPIPSPAPHTASRHRRSPYDNNALLAGHYGPSSYPSPISAPSRDDAQQTMDSSRNKIDIYTLNPNQTQC
ncbi:hypothetical protein BCR39DRAFT_539144 [Naematelia encephala]|uniref:Uncharacterized protein n=1 Tax=Naematelia encephala TaxID=71784 RepID=A0A1Y2AYZ9_9TREE|nr:hypothetical protein BCR39DRAFT_539144 [Naematelia encephala]